MCYIQYVLSAEKALGYIVCQQTPDDARRALLVDEIVAEARAAERAGYRGVFVSEHHQRDDNFFPSPLILATVIARATSVVDVGIGVAVLPLYHPIRLVEDTTCLDIVSGGRVILGLGPGYVPDDMRLYGMDKEEALSRYREAVPLVAGAWRSEHSHSGKWYRAEIRRITPRPVSSPRPRIWIAANTRGGVERAARHADGWIIGARSSRATAAELGAHYRSECAKLGKAPLIAAIRDAWVADTDAEAFEQIGADLLRTHIERVRGGFIHDPAADGITPGSATLREFAQVADERWLVGSDEQVLARIDAWKREVGVGYLIVRFRHPTGPSHEAVVEQIARFGTAFGQS